jgi:large subunit ribosomal protein L9
MGISVEKKKLHLDEPIKRLGNYTLKIKLFKDVEAEMKIAVLKDGEVTPD